MPPLSHLGLFFITATTILLIPGPAVLYVVGRSLQQGRRAGLVSVLGIATGSLFHVAAAALGLSALLMASSVAFSIVKYTGAAYLVFLGIRTLMTKEESLEGLVPRPDALGRIYSQGVVVNILNPKNALFFFAFLPQFVDPHRPIAPQVLVLGMLFAMMGACSDSVYSVLAGTIGQRFQERFRSDRTFLRRRRYLTGGIYLTLGLAAAVTGEARK